MIEVVGIQGEPASYTEAAARNLHPDGDIGYFGTFEDVFSAVRDREVGSAVVAIANNRIGFIPDSFEEVIRADGDLAIVGETYSRIQHTLLGIPGCEPGGITEVHSQAPALGQCGHFLDNNLPDAERIETLDTAGAARQVAEAGNPHAVAIASPEAGKLYGLEALAESIQDDKDNITRFLEVKLAEDVVVAADADKTSIRLVISQVTGSLAKVLQVFADADINLPYLQPRIIPNSPFHIDFFLEFAAGVDERHAQEALLAIKQLGSQATILGSYKAGAIPMGEQLDEL